MEFLKTVFFDPPYNALIALYNLVGDLGVAIILLTILVKLALLPLANKALRSQRRLQVLQPELKKLQEKHKGDREAMTREIMAFYKKEGVSPASSCLPTLVQIPLLITLFYVFRDPFTEGHLGRLYDFVGRPTELDSHFAGLIDLSRTFDPAKLAEPTMIGILVLAVLTGALQFYQSRMLMPKDSDAIPGINKQFMYILPVVSAGFALILPAALPLYWATTTLVSIIQQLVIMKEMPPQRAKAEGVADWNAANPQDAIAAKPAKRSSKKGAQVTVRKRGDR